MNLLADENVDVGIVNHLRHAGHSVQHVTEMEPGNPDEVVLQRTNEHFALLLTEDRDFGELVFRQGLAHQGVVLLRLDGISVALAAELVTEALVQHGAEMAGSFTVIAPGLVRIRQNT